MQKTVLTTRFSQHEKQKDIIMKNFEMLDLHPLLNKSLAAMDYRKPTPIQAKAIPIALEGHDIMGSAQTGTGKTAAFAIPLVERLLRDPKGSALVLTPTRELGKQIMDIMRQLLGHKSKIKTAFIIGGEPMGKQVKQLRSRPRLIVGTPGRINDHLARGNIELDQTDFLVLDETDRMLDMGFTVQLEEIFKFMPAERQTLMFSATLPKNILKMSEKYMSNPQRVNVGDLNMVAKNIKQEVIRIDQGLKYGELMNQLEERTGSVIVFVKTKHGADKMAKKLRQDGFTSEALHGDLRQSKRDKVMQNFRKMNFRVLIATDIAARGLDVPHIQHVINYDLPQVAEDFIHRMGRTARAGAKGSAISFVSHQEGRKWHAIERLLNPDAANDDEAPRSRNRRKPFKKPFKGKGKPKDKRTKRSEAYKDRDQSKSGKKSSHGQKRNGSANGGKSGQKRSAPSKGKPTMHSQRRNNAGNKPFKKRPKQKRAA